MKIVTIALASVLLAAGTHVRAASAREDSVEWLDAAAEVLHSIQATPDHGIPDSVLNDAQCNIVVPHLIKGGFIFGAKHGRGVATCRTADGWSAPAFVSIGSGSWGLQIGVQEVDLIMLVMNDHGVQHLLSSKFEMSGEGSVVAGPVGRQAVAGTDWSLNTEILSYSRTKGIFAGLTLEGAVVEQGDDSTFSIYDRQPSLRSVLIGTVSMPATAEGFEKEVNAVSMRAREDVK